MIKILGKRRIIFLALLVIFNGFLGGVLSAYFFPEKIKKDRELRSIKGQVSSIRSDIDQIQVEFEQLEAQQDKFEELKKDGFFSSQGRKLAQDVFEQIQEQSGVITARASVDGGKIIDDKDAQKSEHKILESPMSISIEAMDDVGVFNYIYLIQRFFPGHVSLDSFSLKREQEVSGTILRSIATGSNPKLVGAKIDFTWRTMIPQSDIIKSERRR